MFSKMYISADGRRCDPPVAEATISRSDFELHLGGKKSLADELGLHVHGVFDFHHDGGGPKD